MARRRSKIDVEDIGWSEQIKEDVSISGSFTVDGSTKVSSNSLVNQKAIQFDGTSPFDEVTISDATTATSFSSGGGTDKPFTISMWVNLEEINFDGTTAKHQGGLYTKRTTSPNDGEIFIGVASGHLQFILYADPDQNGVGSFSTLNRLIVAGKSGNYPFFHAENTWFHACITYDGSKTLNGIRIYKNSHPVGQGPMFEGGGYSTANPSLNVPNQVFFGTSGSLNYSGSSQTSIPTTLGGINVNDGSSTALAGKLADVCRFNRVLTHTEVQELYNDGNVKNMEEHSAYNDLVHWWKMGDHIDTTGQDGIKDYVGGYHGTLGGDASIVSETTLGSDVSSTIHFNPSGSVGIGTSNPGAELDVIGNSKFLGDADIDGDVDIVGDANISGSLSFEDYMILSVTADNTDIQTGTSQFTFRVPFAMELYQIPRASLTTASSSGAVTIDINSGGTSIFSTNLTIDASETTSTTAATAAVLSTTSITDDSQITIDVDGAGTGARGLKITFYYRRTI